MSYPSPNPHGGGYIPPGSPVSSVGSQPPGPHGGGYIPGQSPPPARPTPQQYVQQPQQPYVQQPQYIQPQPYPQPAYQQQAPSPAPALATIYPATGVQPPSGGIQQAPQRRPVSGTYSSEKAKINGVTASAAPVSTAHDVAEYNDTSVVRRRPEYMRGDLNRWEPYMYMRWFVKPHFVSRSGFTYAGAQTYRHRDVMTRVTVAYKDDRYISPNDGKIKTLVVQTVDDILSAQPGNGTWKRTYIRNMSPWLYRIATWPVSHIDMRESRPMTGDDWGWLIAKWIPASLALIICIGMTTGGPPVRNNGNFDAFAYKYYGYPKVARNSFEEDPNSRRTLVKQGVPINPISERILQPRYLCFLRDPESQEMRGWYLEKVEEWKTGTNSEKILKYIVVTYTGEQFRGNEDLNDLHKLAERAARNDGAPAYWIGCTCMPDEDEMQEDVYRISDVIRGCSQVVIAVGPPTGQSTAAWSADAMLRQWGTRVWTFPEVLLAPSHKPIMVYCRGKDIAPFPFEKNQFAAKVWADAPTSRQLIDHYEGNLILSRLELVTLALECLQSRDTWQYLPGDHTYALMGLLRTRPTVDSTDTGFQAFARLSLANDSDRLLERLIAIQPANPAQPWHTMRDAYGCKLWDIEPRIQIAGIGEDDTVIVDNARAAHIRWKSFYQVAYLKKLSWKRLFAVLFLHTSGMVWIIGVSLLSVGGQLKSLSGGYPSPYADSLVGIGAFFFLYAMIIIFASPYLLRILYGGKLWGTQSWFFAFEGYLSIETIEKQIFGAWLSRLDWHPYGSPLSRHRKNEWGECEGIDPTTDPTVKQMVERAKTAQPGEQRIFTLVDTSTMTVTLFQAARPPIGFIMVGSEGGMQRAVGVSLDWTTGTLYRETVIRMETPNLDKMPRVPRVKIGLKRPAEAVQRRVISGQN